MPDPDDFLYVIGNDEEMLQHLQVLELGPEADFEEVQAAWRQMVCVWHPDRFGGNEKLRQRAEEKTKTLNHSYETLRKNWSAWERFRGNFGRSRNVCDVRAKTTIFEEELSNEVAQTNSVSIPQNFFWILLFAAAIISWIGFPGAALFEEKQDYRFITPSEGTTPIIKNDSFQEGQRRGRVAPRPEVVGSEF